MWQVAADGGGGGEGKRQRHKNRQKGVNLSCLWEAASIFACLFMPDMLHFIYK